MKNLEDNIEHPMATFLYMLSTMHCTTVSLSLDGEGLVFSAAKPGEDGAWVAELVKLPVRWLYADGEIEQVCVYKEDTMAQHRGRYRAHIVEVGDAGP